MNGRQALIGRLRGGNTLFHEVPLGRSKGFFIGLEGLAMRAKEDSRLCRKLIEDGTLTCVGRDIALIYYRLSSGE